jgi:acyl-CoA thioester hydrolase
METRRSATVRFAVPFADGDPMQIVWHGNYYRYFDMARDRLFSEAGLDLYKPYGDEGWVFPITRTQSKHIRPLRFRDEVECTATLVEAECRLVIEFEIRMVATGELCTRGRTEQAGVRLAEQKLELRLPESLRHALGCVQDIG